MSFAALVLVLGLVPSAQPAQVTPVGEHAVFAGGCYWGVEAVFEHVRGVSSAVSGFSEGVESVEVRFDPSIVSYRELLEVFFTIAHDPTSRDRQGPDVGPRYRAIVFHRDAQRGDAEAYLDGLRASGRFQQPIVTELRPFRAFTPATPDQQDYVARHPDAPYVVINDLPKLERLRQEFPQLYIVRNHH